MKKFNNILALSLVTAVALSAAPLTTGDILNQTKKPKMEEETKSIPQIKGMQYKEPLKIDDKATTLVKGFTFTGNSVFSNEVLQKLVQPYINQNLGINKLKEIASIITKYYRDNSYFVAKAYIPQQTLKDGIVEIAIIEGTYGGFDVTNKSIVKDSTIQNFMDYLKNGQIVSTNSLERQMLLINELGGAIVTNAEVYPGKDVGTSNFKIEVDKTPKYSGYATLDNYGSKYTGEYKTSVGMSVNSISGIGDILSVSGMVSNTKNLKNGSVSYERFLGYSGLKGGATISLTDYTLAEIANYEGDGTTTSFSGFLNYPIVKTRAKTDNIRLELSHKSMRDNSGVVGSTTEAKKSISSAKISLNDIRNTSIFHKTGKLNSTLSLTAGNVKLKNDVAVTNDVGLDSEGKYTKINLDIYHNQNIIDKLSLNTTLRFQNSLGKNLDSSEDMSVGGSNGIKAYEDSELSGDKGYLVSLELTYQLPNFYDINYNSVSLFTDSATIWKNTNTFNTEDNKRVLNDFGVGYNIAYKNFNANTTFAHGFGNEAQPTSETEFSKGQNKFLFQAMYRF